MTEQPSFNLICEPWIPILRLNGQFNRVGIREALVDSGRIRQIAASNPMDNVALLRFLLAVLLWCKDDAKSALAILNESCMGIPEDWLTKLDDHKNAFNLLGESMRFYQDASIRSKEPRPIADLLVEFPGADSVNHMRHVVHDGSYGFCPACCALGILRLSVWAPANAHYPASVNPGSACYALVDRRNLLLTLTANLPEDYAQADEAPWLSNKPPDSPSAVAKLGWRPRKLWLNVGDNDGHCAYCGQPGTLVKYLCIEKGWPTPVTMGQQFGKDVLAEFQKLNGDYKAKKTDRRKLADKVVKIAPVILKCRMPVLLQADFNAGQARDAAKIARVFDQLYTAGKHETIKGLTKKPTKEELPLLDQKDTQLKKFWVEDPHLLKESEAIGLPDLNADVAEHASKFWRDALRLRGAKGVAIGIVGDGQYIFHDTPAVRLPDAAAAKLASLTKECAEVLRGTDAKARPNEGSEAKLMRRGVLRTVTPNPDRQHPEVYAATVLLTPETEARIRAALDNPADVTDLKRFLRDIYQPIVEQVVDSTAKGSPLRRRAAKDHAQALLNRHMKRLVDKANQPAGVVTADVPAKPKRGRKKKESRT
ncbi:MAG: type I-E CRISPR-associated protein Cse1/CasA [Planctomycetaceae bacterium]